MANFKQAPLLKSKGEKNRNNKWHTAIRTHHLESLIMNGIDGKCGAQLKIMFFLTGHAADKGFAVAEKTIMSRCGIAETTYKKARKALVKKGWIIHNPSKNGVQGEIIVDYDAIYATEYKKNTEENSKNEDDIESTPKTDTENKKPDIEKSSEGDVEDTYNIITDSISNNINSNTISSKDPVARAIALAEKCTDKNGNFVF